ncbi:INO80 complex subunit E isoform X3 [Xenopus laevis]|uniref:INO80 complex subunit E isoform X3 n=1 Tax=Xenopus laevis TaxID=8355 RepID=A0A8J0U363_XENLA|nr:INO80 complex subunit E isoform X3 [Xenopus laevis]
MNGQDDDEVDYKRKYKNLKRKLKFLVYEQECFQEELRRAQRKLLKVSRDKSFLLDRILQYENVDEDSSDSDVTASSENSDIEGGRGASTPPTKRKRSPPTGSASPTSSGLSLHTAGGPYLSAMSSPPYTPFPSEYLAPLPNSTPPKPERAKRDVKNRGVKPKKPKVPALESDTSQLVSQLRWGPSFQPSFIQSPASVLL